MEIHKLKPIKIDREDLQCIGDHVGDILHQLSDLDRMANDFIEQRVLKLDRDPEQLGYFFRSLEQKIQNISTAVDDIQNELIALGIQ